MVSVRGYYKDGVVVPAEPVEGLPEQDVTINFEDDTTAIATAWDALTKLIEECQVDTGIPDLAHQHDHYLYGTPKRED